MSFFLKNDSYAFIHERPPPHILTHEYPDNEDEIIDGIKLALTAYKEMKNIYDNIKKHSTGDVPLLPETQLA